MLKKSLKDLPETAGIYIFWSEATPIYIGKAVNLKRRLESYFRINLTIKTQKMMSEAHRFTFIRVNSELEALLLEAKLIKENQPKYNFIAKDDKHPLYIKITKEVFPRIITVRKSDAEGALALFGPFPSSQKVFSVLRMIRKIIPFSDHKLGKRACIYSHIGLCNPCPNIVKTKAGRKQYMINIRRIKKILSGKIKFVINDLEKEMTKLSDQEKYEEAAEVKQKIEDLNYITQRSLPESSFLENPNLTQDLRKAELDDLKNILKDNFKLTIKNLSRIECFDVSHISGKLTTASMVTFIDGEVEKSLYRRFRVKQKKGGSDTDSLSEIAQRRIKNLNKWGRAHLILVDGGRGQVSAFNDLTKSHQIPVIGIEKQFESLVLGNTRLRLADGPAKNLVVRIRDESHRFAQKYHNLLIYKDLFKLEKK